MKSRLLLVVCHDVAAILAAWWLAFLLRYNLEFSAGQWQVIGQTLPWVAAIQAAAFWRFGLYRGMWRFASLPDLKRILLAVGFSMLAVALVLFLVGRMANVPRSVLLLDPLLLVLIMGGSRFLYRSWKDGHLFSLREAGAAPVLVVGAGEAAAMLIKDLSRSAAWRVVGLLDDDAGKHGRSLSGVPVLGPAADVGTHAARLGVAHAIVAMPSASAAERRRAVERASQAGLAVLTVPTLEDMLSGRVAVSSVRRVELEDLLGREPVALDAEGVARLLSGKTVLVTGAGGSIGSELARQIARHSPKRLVFYEVSEFALYTVEQAFAGQPVPVACAVGDVKDAARLDAVFGQWRPDVVFHAAAYKHVPMMENENAWEAVRNNVLGTLATARAAIAHGAGEFVLVSTDKAVNPTNVMGATKRLAERVCQSLHGAAGTPMGTRFVAVRFGNVLGSSGSVIPKFREQIAKGGPVTVTHQDIIRYFMLIPEAAQLVLQAAAQANRGNEGGETFVLDMGEPVRIADLARDMIRLSGFAEEEIGIAFTGLRPGEKLYEELLADGETTLPTPHPKLRVARPEDAPDAAWLASLEIWLAAPVRTEAETKEGLRTRVPEYRPQQS